ncbi:hypothetical protein AAKU55_001992 [Oxalobacteraceae bacterium GrIS 1.11]
MSKLTYIFAADCQFTGNDRKNQNALSIKEMQNKELLKYEGGGVLTEPRGVIMGGDLIDWGPSEGDLSTYRSTYQEMNFPLYEGYGNHDCGGYSSASPKEFSVLNMINEKNPLRRFHQHDATVVPVANMDEVNGHYSWDWDDFHFVQINHHPGSDHFIPDPLKSQAIPRNARNSLEFLEADLARFARNNRPTILLQHIGFDSFSLSWWLDSERAAFHKIIEKYNIVVIFSGHSHYYSINRYTQDGYKFPVNFVSDATWYANERQGFFMVSSSATPDANNMGRLTILRRYNDTSATAPEWKWEVPAALPYSFSSQDKLRYQAATKTALAAACWVSDRYGIFTIDSNGNVGLQSWNTNTWGKFEIVGHPLGSYAKQVAAVCCETGIWTVAMLSEDGHLSWRAHDLIKFDHWKEIKNRPGIFTGIALMSWSSNTFGLFGVADGIVFRADGPVSTMPTWTKIDTPSKIGLTGPITAVTWTAGIYAVYALGSDGKIHENYNSSWNDIGKPQSADLLHQITSICWATARYGIYAVGSDGNLWEKCWLTSYWTEWTKIEAPAKLKLVGPVTAVSWGITGQYGVYALASDMSIYRKEFVNKWSEWEKIEVNMK